jgi:hypothetical protein
MTDSEHTTAKLARALEPVLAIPRDMVERARTGYYHDFMSPLDFPETQLVADLRAVAANRSLARSDRQEIERLAQRVIAGEFDASKEESDAWAASPKGQETFGSLLRQHPGRPVTADGDAVRACADLADRTGAKSFECGYLHDDVPAPEAGWYATAVFRGAKITAEDKASPAEACHELAVRLLTGAQCQHCEKLITLNTAGAMARDVTLMDGRTWTAAEQAKAGLCHWHLEGPQWVRGCG